MIAPIDLLLLSNLLHFLDENLYITDQTILVISDSNGSDVASAIMAFNYTKLQVKWISINANDVNRFPAKTESYYKCFPCVIIVSSRSYDDLFTWLLPSVEKNILNYQSKFILIQFDLYPAKTVLHQLLNALMMNHVYMSVVYWQDKIEIFQRCSQFPSENHQPNYIKDTKIYDQIRINYTSRDFHKISYFFMMGQPFVYHVSDSKCEDRIDGLEFNLASLLAKHQNSDLEFYQLNYTTFRTNCSDCEFYHKYYEKSYFSKTVLTPRVCPQNTQVTNTNYRSMM